MTTYDLRGKSVLVTGASGGIGAATVRELVAKGALVMMTDVGQAALDAVAATLPSDRVVTAVADVTDLQRMTEVVAITVERFGRLDVVFANAGIAQSPPATVASADLADYERVIEVDLLGVIRTVKPALPQIIENRGHVLVTSSIYAFANGVVNSAYALSKAGVESFGRALRMELAAEGASAGVLHPGWVKTPLTDVVRGANPTVTEFKQRVFKGPLGTVIEPEEIARAAVRGIERRSHKVIAPRLWIPASLGRGLLNAGLDRLLEADPKVMDVIRRVDGEYREFLANRPKPAARRSAKG